MQVIYKFPITECLLLGIKYLFYIQGMLFEAQERKFEEAVNLVTG